MAGAVRTGARIFFLLLLALVIFAGGALWFDYLGLIDVRELSAPLFPLFGLSTTTPIEGADLPDLLENERLKKQWEALDIRDEELNVRKTAVVEAETELNKLKDELTAKEKELEENQKSFNDTVKEYENRDKQLRQTASEYANMDPRVVVAILDEMDDQDIIDIFRAATKLAEEAGEESMVPIWASLMDPARAAVLKRKELRKPEI